MTSSIFATQASSSYQAQSSSFGESQARGSKQTDSTFRKQLAAQADAEPSDNVEPSGDAQGNAPDASNGSDLKTSALANANGKTSAQQPGLAAWSLSSRQIIVAPPPGKPASQTALPGPVLPNPRNPAPAVPAAAPPKSANSAQRSQSSVPPEANAGGDETVKSAVVNAGKQDNPSVLEPESLNNPRQTGGAFTIPIAAPGKPASQTVLPAPALPNPRNPPTAVPAAAAPKSANRSQPSQNSTVRETGRAGSTNEPAESDTVADSKLTDSNSINFFNVFASPGSGSSDASGNTSAGGDKPVKSAAVKASTQGDLPVSEPDSSNNPRQADVAFALRLSPEQASSGNSQAGEGALPGHSFHGDRESFVVEDRVERSNAANPRQADFAQTEIATQPASSAAAISNAATSNKATDPPETGNPAKTDSETSTTTGEAVKTLNVRMSAGGDQHVDIRVVERSGELSVSVRSADPALTRTLQDRMPELTSRLQDQHFQADTWVPKSGESGGSRNGGFSSQQDQSRQDGNSGNQGWRGQRQKPEWVEELESIAPNSRN